MNPPINHVRVLVPSLWLLASAFQIAPISHGPPPPNIDPNDRAHWKMRECEDAVSTATRLVFEPARTPETKPACSLVHQDDESPFFGGVFRTREVWKVEWAGVHLRLDVVREGSKEHKVVVDELVRNVTAFLDPQTGNLLKVELVSADPARPAKPTGQPKQRQAEKQMAENGPEVWASYPAGEPKVRLVGALDAVAAAGFGPLQADRVECHYVTWRYADQKLRDVWSIHLFNIPPVSDREGVPIEARNHMRHIVDATTGEWVLGTTVPQPEGKPEDKKKMAQPDALPAPEAKPEPGNDDPPK